MLSLAVLIISLQVLLVAFVGHSIMKSVNYREEELKSINNIIDEIRCDIDDRMMIIKKKTYNDMSFEEWDRRLREKIKSMNEDVFDGEHHE